MKKTLRGFVKLISKLIGRSNLEKILIYSAKSINTNLHQHGLLQIGAGTGPHLENGSELFFIRNILDELIDNNAAPVLFDVGANVGNYTRYLSEHLPEAKIFSFEPVEKTFNQLKSTIDGNVKAFNIGFGDAPGKAVLYNTVDTTMSELSTTHKEILKDVFNKTDNVVAIAFDIDTIDHFCAKQGIKKIDFLKIDVEGNELSVLKGAEKMLDAGGIKVIQFEINAHNIYARVFLRDFYLLLKDFDFFRLNATGLLRLGGHKPGNEIFTAQNIVAIHKTITNRINAKFIFEL